MSRVKRNLSDGEIKQIQQLSINKTKCFEDLSNELFYEIFDYFDGWTLWNTFGNLNIRFRNLLLDSSYGFKMDFSRSKEQDIKNCLREFLIPNRHRIVSLRLIDQEKTAFSLNSLLISSFYEQLQSLSLPLLDTSRIIFLLEVLSLLPRLSSLTLSILSAESLEDLTEMYSLIFKLPSLKSMKLTSTVTHTKISLRHKKRTQQYSPIEYLMINHYCYLTDLITLFTYTPQLKYLICKHNVSSNSIDNKKILFRLPNLRYVSIGAVSLNFNEFQLFIQQIGPQLQVIRIRVGLPDISSHANQWEKLILRTFPSLKRFYFEFSDQLREIQDFKPIEKFINEFTSSFWIERKHSIHLTIGNFGHQKDDDFKLSIQPSRKKWYNLSKDVNELHGASVVIDDNTNLENILPLLETIQITELKFCPGNKYLYSFTTLLSHFPNLNILEIASFPVHLLVWSLPEKMAIPLSNITKNQITKVKIWEMKTLPHIEYIFKLCPLITYLELVDWSGKDLKSIVEFIVINSPKSLHVLGLHVQMNLYETVDQLKELNETWTIQCQNDKILLQWK